MAPAPWAPWDSWALAPRRELGLALVADVHWPRARAEACHEFCVQRGAFSDSFFSLFGRGSRFGSQVDSYGPALISDRFGLWNWKEEFRS